MLPAFCQRLFGLFAIGDVQADDGQPRNVAGFIQNGGDDIVYPPIRPLVLERYRLFRFHDFCDLEFSMTSDFFRDKIVDIGIPHIGVVEVEPFLSRFIGDHHFPGGIHHECRFRDGIQK